MKSFQVLEKQTEQIDVPFVSALLHKARSQFVFTPHPYYDDDEYNANFRICQESKPGYNV